MKAKTTLVFIDPMGDWLYAKDYENTPPIPRIGELVTINKPPMHRKVMNVVYVYDQDTSDRIIVAIHLSQVV